MDSAAIKYQDASLASKCRDLLQSTFPFFVIHSNQVSILSDATLFSACSDIFTNAVSIFALPGSYEVLDHENSLRKVLSAIFDTDHRAFVLKDSDRILSVLDEDAKGCILAQAIAGMLFILGRLASSQKELTPELFDRELRLFSGSEQRRRILDHIERSHLWGNCFSKIEIRDMILEVLKGGEDDQKEDQDPLAPVLKLEEDILDPVAWMNEQRPIRDLGVPEGLTIMALN